MSGRSLRRGAIAASSGPAGPPAIQVNYSMRGPTYFALRAVTPVAAPYPGPAPVWTVIVNGSPLTGVTDPNGFGGTMRQAWRSGLPAAEPTSVTIEWEGFTGTDLSPTRVDAAIDNDYPPAPDAP